MCFLAKSESLSDAKTFDQNLKWQKGADQENSKQTPQ